jgi:inosose dehydratase
MAVRLGVSPIGWSNDDLPELGGETPLETCLAEAREAGFVGIELGHKFPRSAARLRPLLQRHGLALISGWYSGRLLDRSVDDEMRAIAPHRDLLTALGCRVLVYAETTGGIADDRARPLSARPCLGECDWSDFGARLTDLASLLKRSGTALAYHHHMGTVVETADEIDRLMEVTGDSVGLLLDTGHLVFAGGDPTAAAQRHGGRINHVHCKDVRGDVLTRARTRDASFLDAVLDGVFTVPGDGVIDFDPVLSAMAGVAYDGWLVVEAEQDPAMANPLIYAKRGFTYLSAMIARARFKETS